MRSFHIWRYLLACLLVSVVEGVRITRASNATSHRRLSNPVHVPVPSSPDDHLVKNLPLLSSFTTEHWAGLLPASEDGDKYLFYWLFAPSSGHSQDDTPLVLWLNGGPGCSSMDGLFLENGPLRLVLQDDGSYAVEEAQYSWHNAPAWTLYVDQPVGTGLSFTTSGKYPRDDEEVNKDFFYFLQSFFDLHRDKFVHENRMFRPFYFSGESHAGHYIPHMMRYILHQKEGIDIPVSGAAIGNGWMHPFYQYAAAEAAYGHGIVGMAQVEALKESEKRCQDLLLKKKYRSDICFDLLDDVVRQSQGQSSSYTVSQYDVRFTESVNGSRDFPPGHRVVETYLGGWPLDDKGALDENVATEVRAALHATPSAEAGQRFQECTDPPYEALSHQDGKDVVADIVQILEHPSKPRLLFFNGVEDLICNHVGNEKVLDNLPWKNRDAWTAAKRYSWSADSEPKGSISGYMKEYENLLFLKVLGAGHMVPMDRPDVSLDMIRTFVYNGSFLTYEQHLTRAISDNGSCPKCPNTCQIINEDGSIVEPNEMGSFIISYAWVVALLVVGGFFVLVTIMGRKALRRPIVASPVYDLELREGSTYRDEPNTIS